MRISRFALVIPAVLALLFGFAFPVAILLSRSFLEPTVGLGNYVRLIANAIYVRTLVNTVIISALVTAICAFLAFPVACTLASTSGQKRALLSLAVVVPFWTSVLVRTFGWMVILQRHGIVNGLLMASGMISEPLPLIYNRFGTLVGMVHVLLPFMIFPLYSVVRQSIHHTCQPPRRWEPAQSGRFSAYISR